MRIGHVEGKNVVYDSAGRLILVGDEGLLREIRDDNLDVSEGSGLWNMSTLFDSTAEKGRLLITDRRIVLLRRPDPLLAARNDAYPLGIADAVAKAHRSKLIKSRKALEFCEIELDDVEGFWVKKRTYGVLFLRSSPDVTRKAIMYQRGPTDDKFQILKSLLSKRLPTTEPEDRKGSFLLGVGRPFTGRRR